MVVSDIDLRLLKVFRAVVEAGGFSNAQAVLNVSQSTISTQMSQLETRVGFVLCQRGRSGFRLTCEGEAFYRRVVELFRSLQSFESQTAEIRGGLSGVLRIGFLDNIITDASCPLREAMTRFIRQPDNQVRIALDVLSPAALEQGVLDLSLDAAIGIFPHRLAGLKYEPLYQERDVLVCHCSHALARVDDPHLLARALPATPRVVRSFLGTAEFPFEDDGREARVTSLEASAMLILSGTYVGFLPRHYVQSWLDSGELVELLPDKFVRHSQFHLVTRDTQNALPTALEVFLRCIHAVQPRPALTPLRQAESGR